MLPLKVIIILNYINKNVIPSLGIVWFHYIQPRTVFHSGATFLGGNWPTRICPEKDTRNFGNMCESFCGKGYGRVLGCRVRENSIWGRSSWEAIVMDFAVKFPTFSPPWILSGINEQMAFPWWCMWHQLEQREGKNLYSMLEGLFLSFSSGPCCVWRVTDAGTSQPSCYEPEMKLMLKMVRERNGKNLGPWCHWTLRSANPQTCPYSEINALII